MERSTNTKERHIRAIFTDPNTNPRLTLREIPALVPSANQALIKVEAFSLNQGETRTALAADSSYIPGWDFAGMVEKAAADGSTPKEGTRVFGFIAQGSWAEYITAPGCLIAEIPEGVSNAQAASLPIAGTTALTCLEAAGTLLDRRVLITGAAGGVGRFACQLAALAGAKVFAISRRPNLLRQLQDDDVEPAGVFTTIEDARAAGEYDVILDSVGGDTLAIALVALSRDGICVNFGNSARQPTTFNVRASGWPFHRKQCIWLGREVPANCTPILTRLIGLVKQGRLHTPIDIELPWTSVAEAAERLIQQRVDGKIILNVV
jgi:NADPH:quinone reductase-like Zn-dependent oxidoreductase